MLKLFSGFGISFGVNSGRPSQPIEINGSNFDQLLAKCETPLLLDFWAPWCVPCVIMKKAVDKAADSLAGIADVGLVNIDENGELVERFGVRGTPTFVLLRGNELLGSWTGINSASMIKRQVTTALEREAASRTFMTSL